MRFVNKELFKSLQFRIGLVFLAVFMPLMILMIYYSSYAGNVVRDQVAQSNKNLVSLYMGQIDRSLDETDDYFYKMAALDTDIILLDQQSAYYSAQYQEAKIRLFNKISTDIYNYKAIDLFFIYSADNDDFIMGPNDTMTFVQRDQARAKLTSLLKLGGQADTQCTKRWCVQKIENDYFLCHVVQMGNVYVGAWVNVKRLMVPLSLIDLGETGISVLATDKYEPMDHTDFIQENGIELAIGQNLYKLTGGREKFLEVSAASVKGDFSLIALIPEKGILEKLPIFQQIVWFVPLGFVFVLLILLLFLRRLIVRPIYGILLAMRRFKEGNWNTQIPPYPASGEFEVMNTTFNEMVCQIEQLKIEVYEEQLTSQRVELKHLQLQINPHFFLNSLNIVYHLAQSQKYELIQEMALSLVEYFRFMFRSNLDFVPLKDEIKHTRNYLNIQKMRFPNHLTFEITAADSLLDIGVPPLIVQTFVENTIKHAVTMDESIHIDIAIQTETADEGELWSVRIQDTGQGFPPAVLGRLQAGQDLGNENGDNIGIWNVKRRLALLYDRRAQILFSNGEDAGATVEIILPIKNNITNNRKSINDRLG
jgi:two-component system sensor histidine kinase YesM